jgi:hypothetical protein
VAVTLHPVRSWLLLCRSPLLLLLLPRCVQQSGCYGKLCGGDGSRSGDASSIQSNRCFLLSQMLRQLLYLTLGSSLTKVAPKVQPLGRRGHVGDVTAHDRPRYRLDV